MGRVVAFRRARVWRQGLRYHLEQGAAQTGSQRVKDEGLADKVDLQILDYRDLPQDGRFDKVVSVGMFEHVGHANLALYSQKLFAAVREGGVVMNHGITAKHIDGRPVGRGAGEFIDAMCSPMASCRTCR